MKYIPPSPPSQIKNEPVKYGLQLAHIKLVLSILCTHLVSLDTVANQMI